ncbi:MAG: conjugal transfer protein TraX [Lachnospiraceae bacterium]|jgi:hypothetical protein|nr:conjugal transfer protein TraX [Lachnospiraceae bacterium]
MNTFTLKMIALFFMLIDHIGYYFQGTPLLFRIIGRGAYPLFLFCMVWGYHYTKNRSMYLLRLYLMGIFMAVFRYFIDIFFVAGFGYGNHNIFVPLLLVGIFISAFEQFEKNVQKGFLILGGLFIIQLLVFILPSLFPSLLLFHDELRTAFLPNLFINEYGFEFIALGVLMYFLKEKKELFCAMYLSFCLYQFSKEFSSFGGIIQTFMVFALPFMMYYNREKGPGMKYFFYFMYPAHTFLFFYLANFTSLPHIFFVSS